MTLVLYFLKAAEASVSDPIIPLLAMLCAGMGYEKARPYWPFVSMLGIASAVAMFSFFGSAEVSPWTGPTLVRTLCGSCVIAYIPYLICRIVRMAVPPIDE
jgi:hypothetical protein